MVRPFLVHKICTAVYTYSAMAKKKDLEFTFRLNELQKEMLKQLADKMGMNMSACIVHLITTAHAKL
jgi:hypothetical protein